MKFTRLAVAVVVSWKFQLGTEIQSKVGGIPYSLCKRFVNFPGFWCFKLESDVIESSSPLFLRETHLTAFLTSALSLIAFLIFPTMPRWRWWQTLSNDHNTFSGRFANSVIYAFWPISRILKDLGHSTSMLFRHGYVYVLGSMAHGSPLMSLADIFRFHYSAAADKLVFVFALTLLPVNFVVRLNKDNFALSSVCIICTTSKCEYNMTHSFRVETRWRLPHVSYPYFKSSAQSNYWSINQITANFKPTINVAA